MTESANKLMAAQSRLANARAELLELTVASRKRSMIQTDVAIRYLIALADQARAFQSGSLACDAKLSGHVSKVADHLIKELRKENQQ